MSKLLTALIAALFAVTTTSAFAQMKDAPKEPASKATPATPPAKGDTKATPATPSPKAADAPATEKKGKTKSKKSKGEGKKTKGEGTKSEGKAKGKTTDEKAPK